MSALSWSNDRVTTLSKLWLEGLSASQIAKQLGGVTRNAVIGKVHRLGLSGRAAPSKPTRAKSVRPPHPLRVSSPIRTRQSTPPRTKLAPVEGPGLVTSMTLLGPHCCKWPIGDPMAFDFSFCGRLAKGPYCPTHTAEAHRPGTGGRATRDRLMRKALARRG